ncbi:MAG TPA: hypothetical protein VEI46_00820 [Thermodesulfovibrionales bacterium]|nr:hypothetical protein [Thermodesulfovibrionales bacterium]
MSEIVKLKVPYSGLGFEGFLVTLSYFRTLPQLNTLIANSDADAIPMI